MRGTMIDRERMAGGAPQRRLPAALAMVAASAMLALAAGMAVAQPAAAEDLVDVSRADRENAPSVEVSYVTGWNSAVALNDGATAATNDYTRMWGTWGDPEAPEQDQATYTWESPVTVSSSTLHLWQNHLTGDSGVMIPEAWHIEYRDPSGAWVPVAGDDLVYPLPVLDEAAPVSSLPAVTAEFDAVTTDALRLTLDRAQVGGEFKATSVIEWQVTGFDAPVAEPEPEDPTAFLEAEHVAVRTTTGTAPALPDEVWVLQENGPLEYVDVEWETVDAADYAAAGTIEVVGDPAGFDGQEVAATVSVADTLSDVIADVDYAVTLTTPGVEPVLPRTVTATYDDDTRGAVPVTWEAIEPGLYAEIDAIFDVAGAVAGYAPGAVGTVFVVEPVVQDAPLVSIEFDGAPQGAGWYTTAPTATITAQETASPVATVEYTLDGQTWQPYTEPIAIDREGEVTVTARATSEDGAVGEAAETIRIDTVAPQTAVDFVVDGSSATVTLAADDGELGSGVTRVVWSDGPDPSPTGESNNMYATYEEPFTVQLGDEPRYVHVQAQDAAGNVETHVTVELPRASGLQLESEASTRCAAGRTQLLVSVENVDDIAADVVIETPYGTREVDDLAVGARKSFAFAVRGEADADVVRITGEAEDGSTFAAESAYELVSCR
ncbi:hypothetical protein GCM10022219_22250 [Microbacterium oryzae]|uniref:Bacterial Ig-like domain-containing protein n=2 Tax=Microbacterium oryzae TaxID=743009 RepID=A0A6I6E8M7_9MICO|nr:hypothetical protein D7D94_07635 [Microbacterium oryzae]